MSILVGAAVSLNRECGRVIVITKKRVTLGRNINSLRAIRQLDASSTALSKVFARLSSGVRINSASDDAAGLAMAMSLKVDARVFTQALRNVNDGLSLLSVADSALQELSSIVTRQLELAQQAANGIYNSTQRQALDSEAQALTQEFNRITGSTKFNGISLFGGNTIQIQAGYGTASTLTIDTTALSYSSSTAQGDGTFGTGQNYATGLSSLDVVTGDVNEDGKSDVVLLTTVGLYVALGNGNGSFKAVTAADVNTALVSPTVVDLNGDGHLDLIYGRQNVDAISIALGNGNGTFKLPVSYLTSDQPKVLSVGDINNDGVKDVVVSHRTSTDVTIFLGNSNGTFKAPTTYAAPFSDYALSLLDANNDGSLDLQLGGLNSYGIALGNGNGTFKVTLTYTSTYSHQEMEYGDFNNDGIKDLLTPGLVLFGNGNGTFKVGLLHSTSSNNHMALNDFNSDGNLDYASVELLGNAVHIFLGNGNGTFKVSVTYATGTSPRELALGDFNGDGLNDVVSANYTGSNFSIFLSNAATSSSTPGFSLLTQASAISAINSIGTMQDNVIAAQGNVGKHQSRLEIALNNLSSQRVALDAAVGQILDTDIAQDVAEMTRLAILQQTAAAILAHANLEPTYLLKLLEIS